MLTRRHEMSEVVLHTDEQLDIVFVSHYYPPEVNAPAVRVSELARHWSQAGHRVTVITGFPNHPTGVIPPEYRGEHFREETEGHVRILRTWVYAAANQGFLRRLLNYLSFMVSSVLLAGRHIARADVVIGTSPQIFVALSAWILSLWKRAPFVFEVRDIWPEEIQAVGAIRDRRVIWMLERLEMFLYRRAHLIVAVASGTVETLEKRGVSRSKLVLVPNGVDLREWRSENCNTARQRIGQNGEFIVSYIGTHGMAHGLDTVLDAASHLKSRDHLKFIMVGDGAEKARLERRAAELGLSNMEFTGQVSRNRVRDYYYASDVCLVPLRKADLFTRNIPSKIYEIMAASRPLVIGTHGESRLLVQRAGCGVAVEPEDSRELAEAIDHLYQWPELGARMGEGGRRYVETYHDRAMLAASYSDFLMRLTRGGEAHA